MRRDVRPVTAAVAKLGSIAPAGKLTRRYLGAFALAALAP
jgi:hypothetical protein